MSSNILGPEWNLSPDGINIVTENGTIKDSKTALKKALDCDLKAIGKSALPSELSKHQVGKIVLQIQKIRNISAPKAKEESQAAPRMLKLTLTDGESYVQAIEVTPISSISRDKTAPGTKVLVNGASVNSGYLLIGPQNFSVLGGQVEHLYEKWLLAKSIQQNHQYISNEGAPPWVAFGGKIITGNQDKPYKSLDKSKDGNADSEFEQQRKEAIAEVSTGAVKKTFGGRVRQNVQPSQNQSNQYNNRGRQNDRGDHDRGGGRRGKFASRDDDGIENHQKPSEKVSLFSFLEDKLPISDTKKPAAPSPSCNKNNCNDYHQRDPRIQQKASYNSRQQYDKNASNNYAGKDKSSYNATSTTTHTSASKPLSKPEPKSALAAKNLPQKSGGGTVTSDNLKTSASETRTNSNNSRYTANSGGESNSSRNSQQKNPKDQNWNGNKDGYHQQPYQGAQNQHRSNNDRYAQQQPQGAANQYRSNSDRYPPKSTNSSNSTTPTPYPAGDNFSHQQQNNYRSNDRYSHQQQQQNVPPYPRDNFGHQQNHGPYSNNPKQQYPNANSYPQQANTQYSQKPPQNAQPSLEPAELHQLANNLSKMSVSNEFASRSLRQHLNLGPPKKQEGQDSSTAPGLLNVGEQCMAKYWEDGKFYPAIIAAITEKTYAVQFKGYGNIEEVLKHDCFSAANAYNQPNRNPNFNSYQQNNFSGTSMEFRSRRGPPRN